MDQQHYQMHAEICRCLGNPKRLQIIDLLRNGEMSAGELGGRMDIPKANLSQHLQVLKSKKIINSHRAGTRVYYSISDPNIVKACQLMREVLIKQLKDMAELHSQLDQVEI